MREVMRGAGRSNSAGTTRSGLRGRGTRWRVLGVVVAAIVAASLTATPALAAKSKSKYGGEITYSALFDMSPTTFNPVTWTSMNPSTLEMRLRPVYDGLVLANADGTLHYGLAESMESTDGTTWTMKLRKGVKFSDGKAFDATAVKSYFDFMLDPKNGAKTLAAIQIISSVTVEDASTLKITLAKVNGSFPAYLAGTVLTYVPEPTALRSNPNYGAPGQPVIGAGPYLMTENTRDVHQKYERNPNYWGKKPYLDGFTIVGIADNSQRANSLIAGSIDAAFFSEYTFVKQATDAGMKVKKGSPIGANLVAFNTTRAPFNDIRARKAVSLAIDPEAMNNSVYQGLGTVSDSMFPKGSFYRDPEIHQMKPNAKAAQKLFDELAAEKGGPLKFNISTYETGRLRAEWIQARLRSFKNVEVSLDVPSSLIWLQMVQAHNFDMTVAAQATADPVSLVANYFGPGANNWAGWDTPATQKIGNDLLAALTDKDRKKATDALQKEINKDLPLQYHLALEFMQTYNPKKVKFAVWGQGAPDWQNIRLVNP
jgi:peptide/nickel transport system substrate-binding protein